MRRLLVAGLVLLGVLLAGFLLLRVGAGPSTESGGNSARREPAAKRDAVLAGRAGAPGNGEAGALASIRGLVVDEDGAPVEGVPVRCRPDRGPAASDGYGRFAFEGLAPGTWDLTPTDGVGEPLGVTVEVLVEAGRPLEDVVLTVPTPRRLGGVVVDRSGTPVPHLPMRFRPNVGPNPTPSPTETDAEGRFSTTAWADGRYTAFAIWKRLVGVCEAGHVDARLVLDPTRSQLLRVRIVGPDGGPVPSARLHVTSGAGSNARHIERFVEEGTDWIRIDDLGPRVTVSVDDARDEDGEPLPYAPRVMRDVDLGQDELRIALEAGRWVRGRVVDEAGSPLGGIAVQARVPGRLDLSAGAVSDEAGRFAICGLPPDPVEVFACAGDGPWLPPAPVTVAAGARDVLICMRRGGTFEVAVRDAEGAPVAGALVGVRWIARGRGGARKDATDAQGRTVFHGVPRDALLEARVDARRLDRPLPSVTRLGVPYGDGRLVVDLPAPVVLEGRVVDTEGRPWWDGEVSALGVDGAGQGCWESVRPETDSGAFVFLRLPTGRYRIGITLDPKHPGSRRVEVMAPATDVVVEAPQATTVSGRLLVDDPQAWIVAWCMEPTPAMARILPDGRFRITNARDDPGCLLATRDGDGRVALIENVRASGGPFTLRPEGGGLIAGRIEGFDGLSVPSVDLSLRRGPVWLPTEVDEEGRFQAHGVPPGAWDLVLHEGVVERAVLEDVRVGTMDAVLVVPPLRR